jgi:hypothetical protein
VSKTTIAFGAFFLGAAIICVVIAIDAGVIPAMVFAAVLLFAFAGVLADDARRGKDDDL